MTDPKIEFVDDYLAEGLDDGYDLGIVLAQALLQADKPDMRALLQCLDRIRAKAVECNLSQFDRLIDGVIVTIEDWEE